MKRENTYSNRVPSMLITSSNISSHVASTTPTAFIALLQLRGCRRKTISNDLELKQPNYNHVTYEKERNNAIQGNQLPEVLQKCEVLSVLIKRNHKWFIYLAMPLHVASYTNHITKSNSLSKFSKNFHFELNC